jgi:hypothetical protein
MKMIKKKAAMKVMTFSENDEKGCVGMPGGRLELQMGTGPGPSKNELFICAGSFFVFTIYYLLSGSIARLVRFL